MTKIVAVIPARLHSSRFPRKVLQAMPSDGRSLLHHIWRGAKSAKMISRVFIATDSDEIGRAATDFGAPVIMTSTRPRNGTERVAEAMTTYDADVIINIQADNYGLTGSVLDRVLQEMETDSTIGCATLGRKIDGNSWKKTLANDNVVKVIRGMDNRAVWFSRYPIPCIRGGAGKAIDRYPYLEHIGIYFFRRKLLFEYASLPPTPAEKAESLEQLRLLEHGLPMSIFLTRAAIISVDSKDALRNIKGRKKQSGVYRG